jgi:putative endonuclease
VASNGRAGSTPARGTKGDLKMIALYFMEYYVYVIYSERLDKFYIGTTDDISRRLEEHNSAHYPLAFTVKGIPWIPFLQIQCESSLIAFQLEKFIKKMKSSAFIRRLQENPEHIASIIKKIKSGEIGIPKPRERRT